jgi:GR25 family glycosyltransferase involved in LPS biosynthesis
MTSLKINKKKLNDIIKFYCINYKDENRREKMLLRWQILELDLTFVDPVETTDKRFDIVKEQYPNKGFRDWAIMLQHLDSLRDFVESEYIPGEKGEYVIICEDDIMVSKHLPNDLPEIIESYERLNLHVLLMGYLIPYKITDDNYYYPLKERNYKYSYHGYPDDIWGSQMYMVSRKHAEILLKKYTIENALKNEIDYINKNNNSKEEFSPDWTLTKYGNRSVIYPMMALEEGDTKCHWDSEIDYHQRCFKMHYVEREFI